MTNHPPRQILEDGTRIYESYTRYKPKAPEDRLIGVNKPDDPRAVRFYGKWFLPLDVLEPSSRTMPETRPDTDAFDHARKPRKCTCAPCRRPTAEKWKAKALRS